MNAAAFWLEEDTASVGLKAKNQASFFDVALEELGRGQAEVSGKTEGLIGSDPDGLVVAAGATDLAFEREGARPGEIEDKGGWLAAVVQGVWVSGSEVEAERYVAGLEQVVPVEFDGDLVAGRHFLTHVDGERKSVEEQVAVVKLESHFFDFEPRLR